MIKLTDLAAKIAAKHFLKSQEVESFLTLMADVLNKSLQEKKQVKVKGLGTFKVTTMNARESVDVNTGERILIESRDKISFVPDASMRDLVNSPFAQFDTVVVNEGVDLDKLNEIEEPPVVVEEEVEQPAAVEEEVAETEEQPAAIEEEVTETEEQPVPDSAENEADEQPAADFEENEVEMLTFADSNENEADEQPVFETEEQDVDLEAETPVTLAEEEHFGERIEFVDHFEDEEKIESEPVSEHEIEVETEPETEPEPKVEAEPEVEIEPEVESEVEPEVVAETAPEVAPETAPKPEMEPKMETENIQPDTTENPSTPPLPYKDPKMNPDYLLERIKKKNIRIGVLTTAILTLLVLMLGGSLFFYHLIKVRDARIANLVGELQGYTQNRTISHPDSVEMQQEEWASKDAEAKKAHLDEVREAAVRRFHEHERRVEEEMSKITTIPNSSYEHAVKTTNSENKTESASVEDELSRKREAARKQAESTSKKVVKDPDLNVYNNNPKVQSGAYVIIGVGQTVTVRDGQTFSGISKAYLGPGMESYLEVVNGGIKSVRPGQKLRLPILRKKQAGD